MTFIATDGLGNVMLVVDAPDVSMVPVEMNGAKLIVYPITEDQAAARMVALPGSAGMTFDGKAFYPIAAPSVVKPIATVQDKLAAIGLTTDDIKAALAAPVVAQPVSPDQPVVVLNAGKES